MEPIEGRTPKLRHSPARFPVITVQDGTARGLSPASVRGLSRGGNGAADPTIPAARSDSEPLDGVLEDIVDQVGVNLGGRQIPVTQRARCTTRMSPVRL